MSDGESAKLSAEQRALCERLGVPSDAPSGDSRVGVAPNARQGDLRPLNGLRHRPEGGTSGWYVWCGEHLGQADDFFESLHSVHLLDWCPEAVRFLALPPGWRFLAAPGQEGVWYDATLLEA